MQARLTSRRLLRPQLTAVTLAVAACVSCPTSLLAQSTSSLQQEVKRDYDIAAGMPMADVIREIGRISGRSIDVDVQSAASEKAGAVRGLLTATEAIQQAVKGTSLSVAVLDGGSLWVAPPQKLDTVMVIAKRDQAETSFKADRSDTATRSGSSLMDVPGGVTIITSKVLETQQVLSVQDALGNVSGMTFLKSPQGAPSFATRGFSASQTSNGVADQMASWANIATVERIEVLKGPQAILSGGDTLGGGVNIVTKKPQAEPIRTISAAYGSNQDATLAGDISQALTDDKKLSARLIVAKTHAGEANNGFNGRREEAAMPQLRWKDKATDFLVGISYNKAHAPVPEYTFAKRDGTMMPTPSIRLGGPNDGFDVKERKAFYQLEHKLNDHVTLVSRYQWADSDLKLHLRSPGGFTYLASGATPSNPDPLMTFYGSVSEQSYMTGGGDHYLRVLAETGPLTHKLSIGLNHSIAKLNNPTSSSASAKVAVYPADTSYQFADVYQGASVNSILDINTKQTAFFVQDLISWGDWSLLLNVRRGKYKSDSFTTFPALNLGFGQEKKAWATTPGAGLVYNLTPQVSLYTSYSEGYQVQTAALCGGGSAPPIQSRNREAGAKFDLLDSKLSITTAVFEIQQSNSLTFDTVNRCNLLRDSRQTKGFELDVQGELSKGWSATVNYTYNSVKDVGNPNAVITGIPRQKASLWTIYDLGLKAVPGLGVGLGVSAIAKSEANFELAYPVQVPGHVKIDASAFYAVDKWNFTLGVKNLAGRKLYYPTSGLSYIPTEQRTSFMFTVKRDFN